MNSTLYALKLKKEKSLEFLKMSLVNNQGFNQAPCSGQSFYYVTTADVNLRSCLMWDLMCPKIITINEFPVYNSINYLYQMSQDSRLGFPGYKYTRVLCST